MFWCLIVSSVAFVTATLPYDGHFMDIVAAVLAEEPDSACLDLLWLAAPPVAVTCSITASVLHLLTRFTTRIRVGVYFSEFFTLAGRL